MRGIRILFLALSANVQFPTSTIAGVVRDPSGAAVSGSRLTMVNAATYDSRGHFGNLLTRKSRQTRQRGVINAKLE